MREQGKNNFINKRNYRVNFTTNTIWISRSFQEAASQKDTPEYELMRSIREDFPTMRIHTNAITRKRKTTSKPSYSKIVNYLECLPDKDRWITQYHNVRNVSKSQPNPYQYVLEWFIDSFPLYTQPPRFDKDGKLIYQKNVVPIKQGEPCSAA